ncbi:MAG: cation diffusion facilitator family transporter [Acidobacteriia bacterium]|nr:cation diffusion facilitator family transporter [Terriglobia bacterium]
MVGHHHGHSHPHPGKGRVLFVSLGLTAAFVVLEAVAGIRSGSLALVSDAGHNFTDAFALLLAAIGYYLQSRPGDHVKTFGYQRAGVLAAFANAVTLVLVAVFIFYESWQRLIHPEPVAPVTMMTVASIGLVLNLGIAFGIGDGHDLNLRAAWLHMMGDAASSAAIILGAIAIRYTGWLAIDPVLSILIGAGIVWSAWGIIRDSLNILLEGLPKGLQLTDVAREMGAIQGVIDVHDLHIWSLGSDAHALSCHVLIEDMPPSSSDSILRCINTVLCDRFAIHHTTIQFEHIRCALADTSCTVVKHQH